MLANLQNAPGVQAAGMVSLLPLAGSNSGTIIHVENRPEVRADEAPVTWFRSADAGYFHAMEIPLRRGRLFTEQDTETAPAVVIINETMARRYWPAYPNGEDPVGKRLAFGRNAPRRRRPIRRPPGSPSSASWAMSATCRWRSRPSLRCSFRSGSLRSSK